MIRYSMYEKVKSGTVFNISKVCYEKIKFIDYKNGKTIDNGGNNELF